MKKLLCFVLSLALLCFAGCSGDDNSSADSSSDNGIVTTASQGKLDGIPYGIGSKVSEVREYYNNLVDQYEEEHSHDEVHVHGAFEPSYYEEEADGYTVIDVASARFYFETDNEDKGVLAVATDGETFGFITGSTTQYEVEEAVSAEGKTVTASESDFRFMAVRTEPVVILRYELENYQLDFYFYDNALMTTVIIDTESF